MSGIQTTDPLPSPPPTPHPSSWLNLVCGVSPISVFPAQIEDAGFSLNHPNQYFLESQRLLGGGGKEVKREAEPQPQQRAPDAAVKQPLNPQALAEMTEDLDAYFQDG